MLWLRSRHEKLMVDSVVDDFDLIWICSIEFFPSHIELVHRKNFVGLVVNEFRDALRKTNQHLFEEKREFRCIDRDETFTDENSVFGNNQWRSVFVFQHQRRN